MRFYSVGRVQACGATSALVLCQTPPPLAVRLSRLSSMTKVKLIVPSVDTGIIAIQFALDHVCFKSVHS